MHMFKRGRKAKEVSNDTYDVPMGASSPPKLSKNTKTVKRKEKYLMDEQPVLDLGSALPDTNDFRTSLLMPGLYARFSMLREQDDPNTKVGKASDDSVLFPKRASRLNLFGHPNNALSDIAEVESIRSSIRPPFAERERSNSFGDGYDSDSGSVMSRARPGTGNVLFGGRQKLYRIPTGSTRNLHDPEANAITAKHVYDDDVAPSFFQQYRMRERDQWTSTEGNRVSQTTETDDSGIVRSPLSAFSDNRGTQSSTTSARSDIRASTAATSVASDTPAARNSGGVNVGPSRNMIEVPNTPADSFVQTASPGFRRVRDEGFQPSRQLSQSKSAFNMRDRFQKPGGAVSVNSFRGASPPPSTGIMQPLDFGFEENKNGRTSPQHQIESSRLQQSDDVLARNVQPNDRGKATALGLFNKPAKEFDEQQYLQRQLQMHEGRSSPFSSNSRSASRASEEEQLGTRRDIETRMTSSPGLSERSSIPQLPPIPIESSSPISVSQRASRVSTASTGRSTPPRPRSKSSASATAKDNVKARVSSLIRRQNAELAALEAEKLGTSPSAEHDHQITAGEKKTSVTTFFDNDGSSSEDGHDYGNLRQSATSSVRLPDGNIHPAFRSEATQRRSSHSNFSRNRSVVDDDTDGIEPPATLVVEQESSYLDPPAGFGLSGLIRTHLRQDSDRSFVLPPSSAIPTQSAHTYKREASVGSSIHEVVTVNQKPSLDIDFDRPLNTASPVSPALPSPNTVMSFKAQQLLKQATALRDASVSDKVQELLGGEAPSMNSESTSHDDKEPSHRRGESSETTQERREFDEELAERRRRIQEGLKSVTEQDRPNSPVYRGRDLRLQAFAEPTDGRAPGSQSKAMRTLGIDSNDSQSVRPYFESRNSDEHRGRTESSREQRQKFVFEDRPDLTRRPSAHAPYSPQDGFGDATQPPRTNPSPSVRYYRGRSNSGAAERSKSRSRFVSDGTPAMPGAFPPSQPASPAPRSESSNNARDHRNYERTGSALSARSDYLSLSVSTTELSSEQSPRPSPRPSPIPSNKSYMPSADYAKTNQSAVYSNGRATPTSNGRTTPSGGRKRSGTKTMISEPTFISSTSSVTLVPLPSSGGPEAPPLPEMNPRRRNNPGTDRSRPTLDLSNSLRTPLETVPASPRFPDLETKRGAAESSVLPRQRNRLRKSSSEGGNMAAKARQQAFASDMALENARSPAGPVFPNRSATTLSLGTEGGMF